MSQSPSKQETYDHNLPFRQLVEGLTDYAIYMMDGEGFITTWNAGAARIKGYATAEILGQHFSRFFTPEDQRRGLPQQILSLAREHGRYESEGWRVNKDGRRFWAAAVLEAIRDERGSLIGFGKVTRDITARHEQREALVESERRFRMLVDAVIDYAIYMLDPSGIITNWNAGAERIKGFAAEEVVGTHFSRFYTKEERTKGVPALALETARRKGKYETEGWRIRKDGSRFWALVVIDPIRNEAGEIVGYAKVTRDITERRSAQEALRDSERQFRLLISSVIDYAIYMLDPNGVVVSWNTGAEKIKGYDAEEVIGQHFSRFYTEEDRAKGGPTRALYAATSEGRFAGEGWRVRKDGARFWASVVIDAIRDEQGQLIGFAKITRDITEQREAQLALHRAQEQLAHSQKMDALGQLTGGIAHDFNNLLTIVAGQARILKRLTTEPRGIEAAEAIETTVQRGASLTRQLLGFSRRQPLEPRRLALSDRLPGLEGMLSASLNANTRLISHILPDAWAVMADASELELAIMNLVLNARDAMPEGGTITIAAENYGELPSGVKAELSGSFVAISVVDTGSGIPPDVLAKVFDPFFTTKTDGKGTGLGLAQVYGFAHQSGGTCAIETEVGKGTRVTMYLPRADGIEAAERTSNTTAAEEERIHASVLVVEDNSDVTEVTSALIKQLGHTVRIAKNAAEAFHILEGGAVDLVFSDIMMPGEMDGLALARAVRQQRPRLPMLLASGSNKLVEDASAEFVALQKPYDEGALDRAIQDLLRRRDELNAAGKLVDLHSAKRRRGWRENADQ